MFGRADTDNDGVYNAADNCIDVENADQRDANGDGIGKSIAGAQPGPGRHRRRWLRQCLRRRPQRGPVCEWPGPWRVEVSFLLNTGEPKLEFRQQGKAGHGEHRIGQRRAHVRQKPNATGGKRDEIVL